MYSHMKPDTLLRTFFKKGIMYKKDHVKETAVATKKRNPPPSYVWPFLAELDI